MFQEIEVQLLKIEEKILLLQLQRVRLQLSTPRPEAVAIDSSNILDILAPNVRQMVESENVRQKKMLAIQVLTAMIVEWESAWFKSGKPDLTVGSITQKVNALIAAHSEMRYHAPLSPKAVGGIVRSDVLALETERRGPKRRYVVVWNAERIERLRGLIRVRKS